MKIGLSQRILYHRGRAYDSIEHGWYSYLKDHTLVTLPNTIKQDYDSLAQDIDAFIITGGDDSTVRRIVETHMITIMLELDKPVLGVCHGCFLLADLLGSEITESDGHYDTVHPIWYFGDPVVVNSYHGLAIKKLHDTGTILCTDGQENVEAWCDGHLAGVAWHPERMSQPWLPDEIEDMLWNT